MSKQRFFLSKYKLLLEQTGSYFLAILKIVIKARQDHIATQFTLVRNVFIGLTPDENLSNFEVGENRWRYRQHRRRRFHLNSGKKIIMSSDLFEFMAHLWKVISLPIAHAFNTHMHTHTHYNAQTNTHLQTCTHTHIIMHKQTHICKLAHTHTLKHTHTPSLSLYLSLSIPHTNLQTIAHTQIDTNIHKITQTHTHSYTHANCKALVHTKTHTLTHTYINTHSLSLFLFLSLTHTRAHSLNCTHTHARIYDELTYQRGKRKKKARS